MKNFTAFTDQNAVESALLTSDHVDALVLAANTAKNFAVPTGARFVRLTGTAQFFYRATGAATVPGADIVDGSASVVVAAPKPVTLCIEDLASISVISGTVATISAEWWS